MREGRWAGQALRGRKAVSCKPNKWCEGRPLEVPKDQDRIPSCSLAVGVAGEVYQKVWGGGYNPERRQ